MLLHAVTDKKVKNKILHALQTNCLRTYFLLLFKQTSIAILFNDVNSQARLQV
jgi:hypothetical protein